MVLMQRSVRLCERVSAFLFYFKKIFGNDRIEAALIEAASIDTAGIDVTRCILGFLDQKRAADKNLATGSAAGAFALAAGQQFFVLPRVNTGSNEAPCFADSLAQPKSDAPLPAPLEGGARQTTAGER
jgi:hypothetical protein